MLADYARAIEGKDLALFKSVKPNLSGEEEKRLGDAFKAVKSQKVGITIDSIQVEGGAGHGARVAAGHDQRQARCAR